MGYKIKAKAPETPEAREARIASILAEVESKRAAGIAIHGCFPEPEEDVTISEAEWREILQRDKKRG